MLPKFMKDKQLILVTGPARSGKSEWAEHLAHLSQKKVIYLATSQVDSSDIEWQQRIEKHRDRRPSDWQTEEVTINLSKRISLADKSECLLVDSLGTWIANLLAQDEEIWEKTVQSFLLSLQTTDADIILVGEETGWGVVPGYPSGRLFRDRVGGLVRQVGQFATSVYLITGGHVLNLTTLGVPLAIAIGPESQKQ